jgi:hypothetical protein
MPPQPLNYQPPKDQPHPPTPWWKFRFERRHIPLLLVVAALMSITVLDAAYVESLHRRRTTPPPPPPPASRPTINVTLPPL